MIMPFPLLLPLLKVPFVYVSVSPFLNAETLGFVVFPVSLIVASNLPLIPAFAIGLIIFPLSFVVIAIGVSKLSLSVGFVVFPLAEVGGSIGPFLNSIALLFFVEELAGVLDSGDVLEDGGSVFGRVFGEGFVLGEEAVGMVGEVGSVDFLFGFEVEKGLSISLVIDFGGERVPRLVCIRLFANTRTLISHSFIIKIIL